MDLMRTLRQLGAGVVWQREGACEYRGPQSVRASYVGQRREWSRGVSRKELGEEVHLETWDLGGSEVCAVTAQQLVVRWLAGRGILLITQIAEL